MNQEDSLLDRLKTFFAENGTIESWPEKAECEAYEIEFWSCSVIETRNPIVSDILCAGKELDEGWRVEIKQRKGGSSAGTSDAVSVKIYNFLKYNLNK